MAELYAERPGYFGREKDKKIATLNERYGAGNWSLIWRPGNMPNPLDDVPDPWRYECSFFNACRFLYEESYFTYFRQHPDELRHIADNYGECVDNAPTNPSCGLDYMKQEAFSTHIQDIAVRNCLRRADLWFKGPSDKVLVIRSKDSEGFRWGPGNIPFMLPESIQQPSLAPWWANKGSVEDFWQSNKFIKVLR